MSEKKRKGNYMTTVYISLREPDYPIYSIGLPLSISCSTVLHCPVPVGYKCIVTRSLVEPDHREWAKFISMKCVYKYFAYEFC
jgi:hypothetical protein